MSWRWSGQGAVSVLSSRQEWFASWKICALPGESASVVPANLPGQQQQPTSQPQGFSHEICLKAWFPEVQLISCQLLSENNAHTLDVFAYVLFFFFSADVEC